MVTLDLILDAGFNVNGRPTYVFQTKTAIFDLQVKIIFRRDSPDVERGLSVPNFFRRSPR